MGDWALLEVTPMDAPPVAALAEPVLGERCVLIGYPPRMVSGSWGGTLLLEGGESPGWRPPPPVVIEGRVTRLNAWNGYRVAAPGAGGSWLDGISGGGAFVERDGRWALIGIVTHGHVAPFRSEIGVRPLNEAARDAWSTPPRHESGISLWSDPSDPVTLCQRAGRRPRAPGLTRETQERRGTTMIRTATAIGVLSLAGAAHADVLYGMSSITQDGQVFVFDFAAVSLSDGAGVITVEALGDYSVFPPSLETMTWDVDGIASDVGFADSAFSGPVDLFQNHAIQSWTISAADMAAITADGLVTITLTNSSAVNYYSDQSDWISVTLEYPAVPAPAGAGLLTAAGLIAARRRR